VPSIPTFPFCSAVSISNGANCLPTDSSDFLKYTHKNAFQDSINYQTTTFGSPITASQRSIRDISCWMIGCQFTRCSPCLDSKNPPNHS
jgi:hypothetical protein